MSKIRVNELARELEVKPGVILELLPQLGVHEKKTHSSSLDEEVSLELRRRLAEGGNRSSVRYYGEAEHPSTDYAIDHESRSSSSPGIPDGDGSPSEHPSESASVAPVQPEISEKAVIAATASTRSRRHPSPHHR